MTKVEREQPVISEELARQFEKYYNMCPRTCSLDIRNYNSADCYGIGSKYKLVDTLARMYVLGYEIEKPRLFYIRLSSLEIGNLRDYLNLNVNTKVYSVGSSEQGSYMKTQFTQEEVDEFLKDEPEGMWVVEEVKD